MVFFQRSIRLPAEVQSDKVEANFKDGVLDHFTDRRSATLTMPADD